MQYEVLRTFPAGGRMLAIGDLLDESEFASSDRVRILAEQRYVRPYSAGAPDVQPTAAALNAIPVRRLEQAAQAVKDACVLRQALEHESRESAQKVLARRLAELEGKHGI
ncbi:MAG: hypothetical protein KatS3mg051_1185 [Anaerolineae bacterium]|nr:MAG: hypothetical protein KatS3mg051_1185 [Anaerolineae bacterium]